MSLGFEQAGFNVAAAFDSDPIHVETHSKNFPRCRAISADLTELSGHNVRELAGLDGTELDVVFGGPPCQGFSLMGKRRSEDPRNQTLYVFARLVRELRPRYFVLENVKGLLIGDARTMLDGFIRRVSPAGYSVVKPVQTLDASAFGVPQRRERVFVLGYRTGLPPPEYPDAAYGTSEPSPNAATVWEAIGDLPNVDDHEDLWLSDIYHGHLGQPSAYAQPLREPRPVPQGDPQPLTTGNGRGLSGCLRTRHRPETVKRFRDTKPGTSEPVSRFYRLSRNGLSPTIRAGTGPENGSFMAPRPIHSVHPRCVTVREAARLHSFPDWFEFHRTKWHGFRQIGNSVPPLLARAVADAVLQVLAQPTTEHQEQRHD